MHTGLMPVFEQKLKNLKSKLKKYLKNTPKDKVDRVKVNTLLLEISKLKGTIIEARDEKRKLRGKKQHHSDKPIICICPYCAAEIVIEEHLKLRR